jgi:hypothetical protein
MPSIQSSFGAQIEVHGHTMKQLYRLGAVTAALVGLGWNAQAGEDYATYENGRFGYRVLYPANLVSPLPEADNGDGRKFKSSDGKITLSVWGENNAFNRSLRTQMSASRREWLQDRARITYTRFTPEFYVLSGTTGKEIFYEKTVPQGEGFATMLWQFPISRRPRMNDIVTRTSRAFKSTVD